MSKIFLLRPIIFLTLSDIRDIRLDQSDRVSRVYKAI